VAGKRQVVVPGGIRKVIQTGGSTVNTATTIQGLEGLVVSIAQLKELLGITTTATGTGGGSTSTASLVPGQGLVGGGAIVGSVPLTLRFPTPPVIWNDALLPDDFVGGAASGGGTGGASTLAGLSDVTITSPVSGQALEYNGTKWVNTSLSSGGGGAVGGLVPIAEIVLTGTTATVTFSGIPQNFRNLVLKMTAAVSVNTAPALLVNFNGDTGTNYTGSIVYSNSNTSAGVTGTVTQTAMTFNSPLNINATSNQASSIEMTIYDYARTQWNKNVSGTWERFDSSGAGYFQGALGGSWKSTAAVASIALSLGSGSFIAGSVFTLYGEGGSGATNTTFINGNITPDSHPASPDPNNDEFEGSALSAQWTITNPSTKVFTTKQGYMHCVSTSDSVNTYVFEPLTNTTAFKYRAKMMMDLSPAAFAFSGLCLYNNANGHNIIWGCGQNAGGRQGFYATALSGSYSSLGSDTTLGNFNAFVYYEIEMDATNVYLRASQSGEEGTFITVVTQALSGNMGGATHIGFMFNGLALSFICDWIRRVDTGVTPATGTNLVNPNVTPDSHPTSPTIYDDEFEFGSVLDTTGARSVGAQAWGIQAAASVLASVVTTQSQGAFQTLTYTGSVTAGIGVSQPLPGGTWEFTAKIRTSAIVIYNSSTWKNTYHGYAGSGTSYLTQSETRNWSTGAYTFNASMGSFNSGYTGAPIYLKVKFDGTNLIFYYSQTGLVADFTQVVSQAVATWVGTATHIGLANSNSCMGLDWFRRTA